MQSVCLFVPLEPCKLYFYSAEPQPPLIQVVLDPAFVLSRRAQPLAPLITWADLARCPDHTLPWRADGVIFKSHTQLRNKASGTSRSLQPYKSTLLSFVLNSYIILS